MDSVSQEVDNIARERKGQVANKLGLQPQKRNNSNKVGVLRI
jgi:hypothetical protein